MTPNAKRVYSRLLLLVLLIVIVLTGQPNTIALAAVDVPSNIRVALFINLGANKYQNLTPVATLQSAAGLNLSWRDSKDHFPIGSVNAGQEVRFTMDGYRALILETADLSAAEIVLNKVKASSSSAIIIRLSKSGKTIYQVTEGAYSSASGAAAAVVKWTNAGVAAGIQSLVSPRAAGPLSVESGPYASAAEASAMAEKIGNAGVDTFIALKPQDGKLKYFVRVGQEVDTTALSALQKAATAAGGQNVRIPAAGEPYVIVRKAMTNSGGTASLYAISSEGGAVLRVDPQGAGGIQVMERYMRSYRGSMELSVRNQSLAVINEVDLEQYLYSVVGAEVGSSWPIEAQKAQAVAARSYALSSGLGYEIAHVVDTTSSQAYYGIEFENTNSTSGVSQTAGEILTAEGKVINAVFSSNAGGITADNTVEIWGGDNSFLSTNVSSPDSGPQKDKLEWVHVALSSGEAGYIRSDLLAESGQTNSAGAKLLSVTGDDVAIRTKPQVASSAEPIDRLSKGTMVTQLNKVAEYTEYSWIEQPMTPEELLASLNKKAKTPIKGPLKTLEVSKRGPSGRVIEVLANGVAVNVGVGDNLRSALNGLRSTLFWIEETGRFTVLNGAGEKRDIPQQSGGIQVVGGDGITKVPQSDNIYVLDGKGHLRAATSSPSFVISGKGYGHGLGLSQWGARGLAEQGYDYQYILKYYYKNVIIEKDAK